ncbi:MAG: CGNR zinc finger domain-containing protein [Gaiellaceae bacterium]
MSPRYDVPKAAPEPLREVQQFVNSVDLEHEVDWLPDWLDERGLAGELERARSLREALRALVLANNGAAFDQPSLELVNDTATRLPLQLGGDGRLSVAPGRDALDGIVAIALGAMLDGSWSRLKACRNCCWSFYDYSPNRSATWCSMQLCGNRKKTRAYRRRRRTKPL